MSKPYPTCADLNLRFDQTSEASRDLLLESDRTMSNHGIHPESSRSSPGVSQVWPRISMVGVSLYAGNHVCEHFGVESGEERTLTNGIFSVLDRDQLAKAGNQDKEHLERSCSNITYGPISTVYLNPLTARGAIPGSNPESSTSPSPSASCSLEEVVAIGSFDALLDKDESDSCWKSSLVVS